MDSADICGIGVVEALEHLKKTTKKTFDVIFMDPPYNQGWASKVLPLIVSNGLLNEDGIIICESALETSFDFVDELPYAILKEKHFKTNKFTFIG